MVKTPAVFTVTLPTTSTFDVIGLNEMDVTTKLSVVIALAHTTTLVLISPAPISPSNSLGRMDVNAPVIPAKNGKLKPITES